MSGPRASRPGTRPGGGAVALIAVGTRFDGGEHAGDAVPRCCDVAQGLLKPVVLGLVPLDVGEVAGGGLGQPCQGDTGSGAESAGIHRGMNQRPSGGRSILVAVQQDQSPGQVLGDLAIAGVCGGLAEPGITASGVGQCGHVGDGERIRDFDLVPVQQFPGLAVQVRIGTGGQSLPVLGPQGGQHQHRSSPRVVQQGPQARGDLLAERGRAEVELSLVQPNHRVRSKAAQFGQGGVGTGGVDGVPQPPRLGLFAQQAKDFPAGAGLAGGGPAHQHRDLTGSGSGLCHHLGQVPVMLALHIRRKVGKTSNPSADRAVHFQPERVGHLRQRVAWPYPRQNLPALRGQRPAPRSVRAPAGLDQVGAPP